jgi:hypothetical protein
VIDFRYHIVSLISVFLALAVGIALGAGPLEETIGNQLTEQVAQLRAEKDALREELGNAEAVNQEREAYLEDGSEELLAGVLTGTVAVVTLPGVDDDVVAAVVRRLGQAGATVTGRVALTPAWTDAEQQTFRSSLVGNLSGYLDPGPSVDASTDAVLGLSLARALTAASPDDPTALTQEAGLLLDVLTSGQLLAVTVAPTGPADAVVVIAPPSGSDAVGEEDAVGAMVELVDALAAEADGVVVGGPASDDNALVPAIRAGDVAGRVATVDSIGDLPGQISLPRALAAAVAGSVGHYGFGDSATGTLPPRVAVDLPAPVTG